MEQHSIKVIARIRSDFKTKFGVPRQSGLVEALRARIVFEPEYRNADALRGIEGFSHLWLIWQFSEAVREDWSPTVRPPRLGGNERMGVFATRSPFRPNAIGLSCVRLDGVEQTAEASGGFAPQRGKTLAVDFPAELLSRVPEDKRDALTGVLAQDPRPHYQSDPQRIYGMAFAGLEVRFRVADGAVYVVEVTEKRDG